VNFETNDNYSIRFEISNNSSTILQSGPKKLDHLDDNFAAVNGGKVCDMSKVCKFYLEKLKTCMSVHLNILC